MIVLRKRTARQRTYEILERGAPGDPTDDIVHGLLIALVLVNVAAVVLASVPSWAQDYGPIFVGIEIVSVAIFTIEYALRIWCAPEHAPWLELPPWRARLKLALQPPSIIDLIAIAPFYLAFFASATDLRTLLVLRLFRFFKLARYSTGIASLFDAIYSERRGLIASAFVMAGSVLIAASAMHYAEHDRQPEKLGTIPDAMYWAVVTLMTVGYGDIVPVTALGKIIASITAVMGIVMLALPVGILASAFAREVQRHDFVMTWSMVARVPLFAELNASEVAGIMRYLSAKSCEPDEVIVRRGEPADSMYFIASGEVEIELPDGPVRLSAGEFFGEIAILTHSERTATVRAVRRSKLLVLDARDLKHLMDHSPVMAQRIREVAQARVGRERISERGDLVTEELTHQARDED